MRLLQDWRFTFSSIFLSPFAFAAVLLAARKTPNGAYLPMLLFPFAHMILLWGEAIPQRHILAGLVFLLQFPLYGFICDLSRRNGRLKEAVAVVVLLHGVAAFFLGGSFQL